MIDVSGAFKAKNNVKNSLFSSYKTLKFLAIDKNAEGKPRIALGSVSRNWYFQEPKATADGVLNEFVYFVPSSPIEDDWADNCKFLELVRTDGSYLRVEVTNKLRPSYPKLEWRFEVKINKEDQGDL